MPEWNLEENRSPFTAEMICVVVCLAGNSIQPINIFDMLLYTKLNSEGNRQILFYPIKLSFKKVHHNFCWLLMTFLAIWLNEFCFTIETIWCLKGHLLESKVPDTFSPKPMSLKTLKIFIPPTQYQKTLKPKWTWEKLWKALTGIKMGWKHYWV